MLSGDSYNELAEHLADRLFGCETAEETLDRIEHYLQVGFLPCRTARALALAAVYKWRRNVAKR